MKEKKRIDTKEQYKEAKSLIPEKKKYKKILLPFDSIMSYALHCNLLSFIKMCISNYIKK